MSLMTGFVIIMIEKAGRFWRKVNPHSFGVYGASQVGKSYLVKDFTIECWNGKHKDNLIYGIIAVIVDPIGIPAFFAYQFHTEYESYFYKCYELRTFYYAYLF